MVMISIGSRLTVKIAVAPLLPAWDAPDGMKLCFSIYAEARAEVRDLKVRLWKSIEPVLDSGQRIWSDYQIVHNSFQSRSEVRVVFIQLGKGPPTLIACLID